MKTRSPFRHASIVSADQSGGKLPPVPMSKALRDALDGHAYADGRSPRDQALVILEIFYGLKPAQIMRPFDPQMISAHEIIRRDQQESPDLDDVARALGEIERLSEGDE